MHRLVTTTGTQQPLPALPSNHPPRPPNPPFPPVPPSQGSLRAKLSDMGLSKTLVPEQSSFESHHGPGGSSGWQAPEQLIARDGGAARQTRSMDVFSLGCILYYCMTGKEEGVACGVLNTD